MNITTLIFLWLSMGSGQLDLSSFQGTIKAEDGTAVEGAVIILKHLEKGNEIRFQSDKKGNYYRRGVPSGDYSVTVQKEGFQAFQDQVRVASGEEKRMHVVLTASFDDYNLGVELFGKGDFEGAAKAFGAAAQKFPEMVEAHVNLGLTFLQLGRLPEGIASLERAIALKPGDGETEIRLAAAYAEAGRNDEALAGFERGLSHIGDASAPMAIEAGIAIGSLHFGAARVEEAQAAYDKVLAADPSNSRALLGVGMCWFNRGDLVKARESFEKAIAAAPDSDEAARAKKLLEELDKPGDQLGASRTLFYKVLPRRTSSAGTRA
jgi:tetratricopeptide (TPR) repeat protein